MNPAYNDKPTGPPAYGQPQGSMPQMNFMPPAPTVVTMPAQSHSTSVNFSGPGGKECSCCCCTCPFWVFCLLFGLLIISGIIGAIFGHW